MDRSDDPRAALVWLRGVHLLPAVLCRRSGGAVLCKRCQSKPDSSRQ